MKNLFKVLGAMRSIAITVLAVLIVFSAVACSRSGGSASDSASGAVSASASNSIDSLIDEYEQLLNEYISILPRMLAGELAAADEAEEIAERLENWAERIMVFDDDDFTPEQILRFDEIQKKFDETF